MIIIPLIIIGAVVAVIAIILVRIIVAPKRVQQLEQLFKQNRIPLAIKLAKQILAKDSRNHEAHYFLGLCYLAENKPELALMEFKIVNQLGIFEGSVKEENFRVTIAELFIRFNQLEEAQKEYLLLLKMNPDKPEFYYESAKLFELRNHPDKAVKYYKKAIELNPRHADAHARLGALLYKAKYLNEAKESLEKAVRLQPNNAQACFSLGKIYKEAKDFQTALNYFEKSAKDNELKVKSLLERGSCYISLGDLARAEAELERGIKLSNDEGSSETIFCRYLIAYCHEQNRKYDEAIHQWEKIQAKKPNFRDVPAKLAQYQDLRTDDQMKDYLTASDEEFVLLCKTVIERFKLLMLDFKKVNGGFEFLAGENSTKWRNTKKLPTLFCFVRETEPIEESAVREFYEKVKSGNINRGVFVTSSGFTRGCREFAESRPIDLVDKEKLQTILKQET